MIALVGYAVARGSGASRGRSMVYATAILLVATVVAVVKNVLAGHRAPRSCPISWPATVGGA